MKPKTILNLIQVLKGVSNQDVTMSLPLLEILMMVADRRVTYMSDIAQALNTNNSSVTHYLQRLASGERSRYKDGKALVKEGLGFVEVSMADEDFRKRTVTLTEKGKEFIQRLHEI